MAHYLAHIMFLSCLTCAMIRYNMQIFSYIENSQKWIWKVGIILRRKINKRYVDKRCKTGLLVAAYSGTRVPKITKCVPSSDYM